MKVPATKKKLQEMNLKVVQVKILRKFVQVNFYQLSLCIYEQECKALGQSPGWHFARIAIFSDEIFFTACVEKNYRLKVFFFTAFIALSANLTLFNQVHRKFCIFYAILSGDTSTQVDFFSKRF